MEKKRGSTELGAEINSYLENVLKEVPSQVPKILYHYTDAVGLKGILDSRSFWFTDIFKMNDPAEIKHGVEIANKQFEKIFSSGLGDEAKKLASLFFQPALEKIKSTAHYFICCFSKTGDELGQWRAYADDGHGFALGFIGKSLDDLFCSDKSKPNHHSFEISYDEGLLEKRHAGLTEIFFEYIKNKSKRDFSPSDWLDYIMGVLPISFLHKHWGYINEQEYRLMQMFPNDGKVLPDLKHRLKKNKKGEYSLAAFREFSWDDRALLKEIIIGPAANFEIAKEYAQDCLKVYGYDISKIEIKQSEIPYRS